MIIFPAGINTGKIIFYFQIQSDEDVVCCFFSYRLSEGHGVDETRVLNRINDHIEVCREHLQAKVTHVCVNCGAPSNGAK